jgi:hypothetical protein
MGTSMMYLLEEEFEQKLLEEIPSDQNSFSEEMGSSKTDNFTVGEVISAEFCDNENDVHFSSASCAIFTWEDMTNYVGQREQLLITMGLKMKPKMKLTVLKCSKSGTNGT